LKYYLSITCAALIFLLGGFLTVSCGKNKADTLTPIADTIPLSDPGSPTLVLNMKEGPNVILEAYRDTELRQAVTDFFRDLTGSQEIAEVVLINAAKFDIPPALAFALSWEECHYKVRAINRNLNGSVDRGLFQLNSASFPNLKVEEFFDPGVSARYGLAHLRWCLDHAGTEVAALAMYNAGTHRVRSAGTPKSTLDYISRILRRQHKIEELFAERFMAEYVQSARTDIAEKKERHFFRFSLLSPLGRR